MPPYDASHFTPPAPLAHVTLRHVSTGATVPDVRLLIDTGADITLLPRTAVERLGVAPLAGQGYELMGFDGSRSVAPVVALDMIFL
jgi:predicted aspartyl protease